jgi:hypothetical protein
VFDNSNATATRRHVCIHLQVSSLLHTSPAAVYIIVIHLSLQQVHTNRRIADILHETDGQGRPVHVTGLKITGGGGDREEIREFDTIIAATDVPGIKKLLPSSFRAGYPFFDRYYTQYCLYA